MSSILDALRKLEQEQGEGARGDGGRIDPDLTEREVASRRKGTGAVTISIEPSMILIASLTVAILVVAAGASAAFLMFRTNSGAPVQVASVPAQVVSNQKVTPASEPQAPVVREPDAVPVVAEGPKPEPAPELEPDPKPVAETPKPEPKPEPKADPEHTQMARATVPQPPKVDPVPAPVVEPVASAPVMEEPKPALPAEPAPVAVAQVPDPLPVVEPMPIAPLPPQQTALPAESNDNAPVDLNSLPIMSESDRLRLGLPEITINIVGTASARNPRPSAMINYKRVMVGEFIPGTNAKLVGVDVKGIGISVSGTQFFIPKR